MGITNFLHFSIIANRFLPLRKFATVDIRAQAVDSLPKKPVNFTKPQDSGSCNTDDGCSAQKNSRTAAFALGFKLENSCTQPKPLKTRRPDHLKIMHTLESATGSTCSMRIVISGRMADVCAELEKLVLKERN